MYYAEHIAKIMVSPTSLPNSPPNPSNASATEEVTQLPADPLNILIQAYQNVLMDHEVVAGSSTATVMIIDSKSGELKAVKYDSSSVIKESMIEPLIQSWRFRIFISSRL